MCVTSGAYPQLTALKCAPFSAFPLSSGLEQRGGVGEPALATHMRTPPLGARGHFVEQSCPPTRDSCLSLECFMRGKQMLASLAHDISGFLSYSRLDCALTDATLLHLTKDLRQHMRNTYGKIEI